MLIVAIAGVAAAATAVGVAVVQRSGTTKEVRPPSGAPPLALELGVRADPEARALRRAARIYTAGRRHEAERIFARYHSLDARVGAAIAGWPRGTLLALDRLRRENPRSGLVRLHLGFALFWAGRRPEGIAAWRQTLRVDPDSPSAVRADQLLHPNFAPGLPTFVPSFPTPRALDRLSPAAQLALLRRNARRGGVRAKLLYGVALQRLERPISARREFDAAVALAPQDPEPAVAAAVARFDKSRPSAAFARLGPLSRRYPRSPTVRFHLGLCLLWLGDVRDARRQLRLARDAGPATPPGREATRILRRLANTEVNRNGD